VIEHKFLLDTSRTARLLTTLASCTCGILTQQVFGAVVGELVSFNVRIGFKLETRLLFFFFIVSSFCFFLLETVYAQVVFVRTEEAKGIKTLPHLILRSKQLPDTNEAKQEEGKRQQL